MVLREKANIDLRHNFIDWHGRIDLQHHPPGVPARAQRTPLQVQVPPQPTSHRFYLRQPHNIQARSNPWLTQVSNLSGDFSAGLQAHTEKAQRGTFGYLKHDRKPSPDSFQKKHTGTMGSNTLPPVRNFSYDPNHKKPEVPKHNEKPVLGLKSDKNFIVSNAI